MIEITAEIRAFIDKAAAGVELAEDEYIDLSDGLIHCKKCGGQRQTVVPCFGKSGYFMPRCICQCQREAEEQRKAAEERQRRMERIKRRKAQGLQDRYLYDYTFSNDNGQNPLMDKAHAYVENWKEAYKSNIGLLLFGDVGTGKSFFAGCIANGLSKIRTFEIQEDNIEQTDFHCSANYGYFCMDYGWIYRVSVHDTLLVVCVPASGSNRNFVFFVTQKRRKRREILFGIFYACKPFEI